MSEHEVTLIDEIAAMKALSAEAEHLERLSGVLLVKCIEQRDRVMRMIDNPPSAVEKK